MEGHELSALDLEHYFERIHSDGDRVPSLSTLARLQHAHATTIPFENLDIHLGRPIRIDVPSVVRKLVDDRRGGYCFEQNTLFAAVLESLGFAVTRLAARVWLDGERPTAPTHMALVVEADGNYWLCDVGFGAATPLRPIALAGGDEVACGGWTHRLLRADSRWVLQMRSGGAWLDLYAFTEEPQQPADYEMANHFTSTSPKSPFVQAITVQLPAPGMQLVLRGRELSEHRPDGVSTVRVEDDDALLDVFAGRFGLHFPPKTRFTSPNSTQHERNESGNPEGLPFEIPNGLAG
jgi:N-hydroxyarylamine O-acetyltransferase